MDGVTQRREVANRRARLVALPGRLAGTCPPAPAPARAAQAADLEALALEERPRGTVFGEEAFRAVLNRERQRAERLAEPFVLLLVREHAAAAPSWTPVNGAWREVLSALAAAAGETAVIGWFDEGQALGAIVAGACANEHERVLRQELTARVSPACARHFSIESCVHSSGSEPASATFPDSLETSREQRARRAKRALDLAVATALLVLLAPLFLLIALALKLTSRGPVLFRQRRLGASAQPFTMLKFRTMHVSADDRMHEEFMTEFIRSGGGLRLAGRRPLLATARRDPRVTPIGRILRRTCLDELPQLWNVVRGDMSLVGPRPPIPYEVEQYRPWHRRRVLDVKPGITGLWQVAWRRRATFDDMVRLDLWYARHQSLWADLAILLLTPIAVVAGKGLAKWPLGLPLTLRSLFSRAAGARGTDATSR